MNRFAALVLVSSWPALGTAEPATLILTNAKVVTLDDQRPQAQALAVRGDKIAAVGSAADVAKLKGPDTRVIDLGGKLVVPGFIESHSHFVSLGRSKMILDLTKAKTYIPTI